MCSYTRTHARKYLLSGYVLAQSVTVVVVGVEVLIANLCWGFEPTTGVMIVAAIPALLLLPWYVAMEVTGTLVAWLRYDDSYEPGGVPRVPDGACSVDGARR